MATAEAHVARTSSGNEADPYMARVTEGLQQAANNYTIPAGFQMAPEWPITHSVYVFNIAEREFTIQRPPMFPNTKLKECPAGTPYRLVMKIPSVVVEKTINAETNQFQYQPYYGERIAMDLINPQNPTLDQDAPVPSNVAWMDGGSNDMGRRGLFWSHNEVPTEEELKKARARLEAFYRSKIQEGSAIAQDPKRIGEIAPEHHMAADYFLRSGLKLAWHTVAEMPDICPNCGEDVRKGAAFHTNSAGVICILDWTRAIKAGVKTAEDYKKAQAAIKALEQLETSA